MSTRVEESESGGEDLSLFSEAVGYFDGLSVWFTDAGLPEKPEELAVEQSQIHLAAETGYGVRKQFNVEQEPYVRSFFAGALFGRYLARKGGLENLGTLEKSARCNLLMHAAFMITGMQNETPESTDFAAIIQHYREFRS